MKRANLVATIGILGLVTLGAMGCVEDDVSFYIAQNSFPGKDCSPSKEVALASGVLDVDTNVGLGYYMFPLVVNNMVSSNAVDKQPERNNLHMKRFDVTLELAGSYLSVNPGGLEFSVPLSGVIPAQGEAVFGPIQVIDDQLAAQLGAALCAKTNTTRPVITISLRAVAERSSETRESAEFVFPVTLCCKCLVDWRPSPPVSSDKTVFQNECGAPQDARVTCYEGAGNIPVCLQGSDA